MTARDAAAPPATLVQARYLIDHKLGQGAAGAVYLARDRDTGEQLALKKLFRMDAKTVLRLKREFRSLQALNHPHIVKMYDMGQDEDAWFLTMEYLDGSDLTTYLAAAARGTSELGLTSSLTTLSGGSRLLAAFRQLASGVQALHDAGMLHRDLKPSNVLVVDQRVVVLDFGLVRELSDSATTLTEDGSAAGTPAYMAPEQIRAQPLTAACDWYAFGVMLYEAISGLLPFDGPLAQLFKAKLETNPVALEEIVPDVPRGLSKLCMALLRVDPHERPSGAEVLERLNDRQPSAALTATKTDHLLQTEGGKPSAVRELVGRATETKQLWAALAQAERGSVVVVHVRAPSGAGKSALVERFLDHVERLGASSRSHDVLVLRSRCYELEAMPFKALDGIIDALAHHLARLDDVQVAHLLPADIASLVQVFPVLERLSAVKRLMVTWRPTHEVMQSRTRAETALRALFDNLAARAPLVLWIDDLQWGDLDSARILRRWLLQPSVSPILFAFSYRSDEVATSGCLQELLNEAIEHAPTAPTHTIDLAPLAPVDVRALCDAGLAADIPAREGLIERVVREAQGSPFFASQLIALAEVKAARGDTDLDALSLDLMLAQTSAMLTDDANKVLAALAVAGRPMSPKLLLKAAAVQRGGRVLLHELRGLNLVRTRDIGLERGVEVSHDRIRQGVQRALSAEECRLIHKGLFDTLEYSGKAEPDWLHTLALGAGLPKQALHYGQAAAARAVESLAFERAAGLYRTCVGLAPAHESGAMWGELASALARCGRGAEAAEASLEAALHVPANERAAWIERAATQFLRSGHFARGEDLVRQVLVAKAIDVPASRVGLIAAIAWERTRIKLFGTRDRVRAGDHPAELLERFDLLTSLYFNTGGHDPLRAALFQARALHCALEAGEPTRLVLALCGASVVAALDGSARAASESAALLARAEAINAKLAVPDLKPICVTRAMSAFMLGRLSDVLDDAREAERLFRVDLQTNPSGNYYTRLGVLSLAIGAMGEAGQYVQMAPQVRSLVDEAIAHDNRAMLLQLTYIQTRAEQISGHGDASRPRLEAQRAELPDGSFGNLHVLHMSALMSSACWVGDYASVRDHVDAAWVRFLRSPVRRAGMMAALAHSEHARFVLNEHVAAGNRFDPSPAVQQDIRTLERIDQLMVTPFGSSVRARLAWLRGDVREAIAELRFCVANCEARGRPHHRARVQYALGVLLRDAEGRALRDAAEQCMRELGVIDVANDLRAYLPELMEVG